MKKILALFGLVVILFFPQSAFAHLAGQPPFFIVNGKYSNLYHVPGTSLENFNLPQDDGPASYLVNQPIEFAFDISKLPAPPDVVKKTKFSWDFGDGQKATGLSSTHTYQKTGSFVLVINAQADTDPQPQIIESVYLNIVPNLNYKLPQAVIRVNGEQSPDPLKDILYLDFNKPLNFDASSSEDQNGKIVSYTWDFGDGQGGNGQNLSHSYTSSVVQTFPLLRITDSNGFFNDQYLEIENRNLVSPPPLAQNSAAKVDKLPSKSQNFSLALFIIGFLILITIISVFKIRPKKKKRY